MNVLMFNQLRAGRLRMRLAAMLVGLGACSMLLLSACGGSTGMGSAMSGSSQSTSQSGSSGSQGTSTGAAMITLTDAPGQFLSYLVTVDSLQLTRADGTVVETVPNATQVDFAQLVDLSEILTTEQIPAGNYVSATLTLDYSSANIVVDNGTTNGLQVTNLLNASGTAALSSPVQMTLNLPSGSPLVITPGTIANLALDFNLAATNALVTYPALTPISDTTPAPTGTVYIGSITSSSGIAVEVTPQLSASLTPDTTKQIRVRGPLTSVNTSNDSYTIAVRPFFNATGSQGSFTVYTTATTTFTINGVTYSSQASGIAALDALVGTTPAPLTLAYGSFDVATGTFTAASVLAGSNVAGGPLDSVEGTVIARTVTSTSDTLTIGRGRICYAGQGGFNFSPTTTVNIGPGTSVAEQGQSGPFTIAAISVGQHIQIFGTYSNSSNSFFTPTLDATAGIAELMVTSLWGTYISSAPNGSAGSVVTLNLQSIDGVPASALQFAGTGVSGQDATASAYTVGVPSSLSLPSWSPGSTVSFTGFVSPFGTANGTSTPVVPDFSAITLVNYLTTSAQLQLGWPPPGVAAPFVSLTSTSPSLTMTLSTLQSAAWHTLRIGPEFIDVSTLASGLTVTGNTATAASSTFMMQFAIAHVAEHSIDTYASFADLVSALYADLNPTSGSAPTVLGLFADGPYDSTTATLSANQLLVALDD